MYVQTAFRNVKPNQQLEDYAVEKIRTKINQFVNKPIGLHLTFEANSTGDSTHCLIRAGDGLSVVAKDTASTFYESVDQVIEKIARQLRKKKTQIKSHKKNRPLKLFTSDLAEAGIMPH